MAVIAVAVVAVVVVRTVGMTVQATKVWCYCGDKQTTESNYVK